MKPLPRHIWSQLEIEMARGGDLLGFEDFDNRYQILQANKSTRYFYRKYLVTERNGVYFVDAPLWYPKRNLKKEMRKMEQEAEARRQRQLAILKQRYPERFTV